MEGDGGSCDARFSKRQAHHAKAKTGCCTVLSPRDWVAPASSSSRHRLANYLIVSVRGICLCFPFTSILIKVADQ
jgi:hypothetical protein